MVIKILVNKHLKNKEARKQAQKNKNRNQGVGGDGGFYGGINQQSMPNFGENANQPNNSNYSVVLDQNNLNQRNEYNI
jgi:hypothetical protein